MTRVKTVTAPELDATCHDCEWTSTAANALANGARHHDAHGHAVSVHVARTVIFGNPDAVPSGQLELDRMTSPAVTAETLLA